MVHMVFCAVNMTFENIALQLNKGALLTFLRPETPLALAKRAMSGV